MASTTTGSARRPLHSYLLRIVEERTLHVSVAYELHDIATGTSQRFDSLRALQRHLAAQPDTTAPTRRDGRKRRNG